MPESLPRLHLFGPARFERAGGAVRFDTKKALALLAYLTLEGPQTRDHLAHMLWPDSDAGHARGALRRTLSAIRSATGDPDIVDAERERVAVRAERFSVDVADFRSRHAAARAAKDDALEPLEAAVAIARPDVLGGIVLRDAPGYEQWQHVTEETLRKELTAALGLLVQRHEDNGEIERAIAHARRWIELDPLHEPAHRRLMRLYASAGNRAAAIEQYRSCVRVLAEELAVAPVEETTRLYESLTAGTDPARPAAAPSSPPPRRAGELPLVGRAREEQVLSAAAASPRFVAIEGEAGIGKTRLAHALVGLVEAAGRRAVEVRCYEGESVQAFGVATRLLQRAFEGASTRTVRDLDAGTAREGLRLIPQLAALRDDLGEASSLDSPGAQTVFFHGVWETLVALLGPGAAVVVDDVHWADPGSLDLIAFGIRRLENFPVTVVATWRRDEVGPDHLLKRILADARRGGSADLLTPRRLDPHEVAVLAEAAGATSGEVASRLFEETEGVPFFVAEYLKAVDPGEDVWPVVTGVRELVRAQAARVSAIAAQVLTAAAVLGRDLTVDLLEAVSGRSGEETVDAVEELERRELLTAESAARPIYHFAHEKVRQVVFEETSLARRRLLHRRAAEHLERRGEPSPAARHAELAGRDDDAARLHAAAGAEARRLFAHEEALAHLEASIALGHPDVARLHEEIGDAQTLLGRYADALASYEAALAYASDDDAVVRLELSIGSVFLREGEAARAEVHFRRAAQDAVRPVDRSRALAELALTAAATGGEDPADLAGAAVAAAEQAGDDSALARARNVAGLVAARRGELDEAREHLRASAELGARVADPAARVAALNNLALAERDAGNRAAAVTLLAEAVQLCERQGDLHRAAALHNNLADVLHAEGRTEESREHSRRAAELFAGVGEEATRQPGLWKLVSW